MKKFSFLVLTMFAASSFAGNVLEGQVFSRTFKAKPMGSTIEMEFTHSLTFGKNWTVVDNSTSWFGNPPTTCQYGVEIKGEERTLKSVTVLCDGAVTRYKYVDTDEACQLETKGIILRAHVSPLPGEL